VRILVERLAALAAILFVALALGSEPTVVVIGVAAALLITAAMALLVTGAREMTVGARAHAHREALSTLPAPAHPSTAGRPRTRAPSMAVPAT
jgi:hypothetical protein